MDKKPKLKINIFGEEELVSEIIKNGIVYKNIISISNPGNVTPEEVKKKSKNILELRFLDIDEPFPDHNYETERMVEESDIDKVLFFFDSIEKNEGITIHCWRGLARSTAVALCLLHNYYRDERIAISELLKIRPNSKPNLRVLSLYDNIFGTNLEKRAKKLNTNYLKTFIKNFIYKKRREKFKRSLISLVFKLYWY